MIAAVLLEPLLVLIGCALVATGSALMIGLTAAPEMEQCVADEPEPVDDARRLLEGISRRRTARGLPPIDVEADLADLYLGRDELFHVGDERPE